MEHACGSAISLATMDSVTTANIASALQATKISIGF